MGIQGAIGDWKVLEIPLMLAAATTYKYSQSSLYSVSTPLQAQWDHNLFTQF